MPVKTSFKELIEKELSRLVPETNEPWGSLHQAARYSLLSGGKRIRPILTLTATECFGGDVSQALAPACALECIHTYSLIHDDLPAMDNDDFRRGKPSLHKAFPEGHAILAGDYLLTRAFEILSTSQDLAPEQKIALIQILSKDAGSKGMIGGQILDIEGHKSSIELVHSLKTGALIAASVEFGAIIAGISKKSQARAFGEKIGLAFQIIDDVLDADEVEKTSVVTLLGIDGAKQRAHDLLDEAIAHIESIDGDMTPLTRLAKSCVMRTS